MIVRSPPPSPSPPLVRLFVRLFVFAVTTGLRVTAHAHRAASASASSAAKCSLVTIYSLKTADCIDLGLSSVPRHLDGDLKSLNFHDNRLSVLSPNNFHMYSSLQNLFLVRNVLEEISDDAFVGLQNLQILDLEGNKLNATPGNAFRHVPSLRILILKSNPIQLIRNDHLRFLKNVETLNFENCWLHSIESKAFYGLVKIYELNLVNNELRTLDADMEDTLAKTIATIRLHNNPWMCDCRLRWLRKFLNRIPNWEFSSNIPTCAGPDLLRAVFLRVLSPEQFACPSAIVGNSSTSIELKAGDNVSIECIVFGDPDPTITWMKGPRHVDTGVISEGYFTSTSSKEKHHRSTVTLRNVTQADASDYKCIAVNPAGRSEVTYKVWVVQGEPRPSTDLATTALGGFGFEVVLGAAIAGLGLVGAFVFLGLCCVVAGRRRRSRRRRQKTTTTTTTKNAKKGFTLSDQRDDDDDEEEEEQKGIGGPKGEVFQMEGGGGGGGGGKEGKEAFVVLTAIGGDEETQTAKETELPVSRARDMEERKQEDEGCAEKRRIRSPDKGSDGFKMKIFASSPTDDVEVCDDRSSTASLKSQSDNTVNADDVSDATARNRKSPERSLEGQRSKIKESPPDLLCDRHVMINSNKEKRLERKERDNGCHPGATRTTTKQLRPSGATADDDVDSGGRRQLPDKKPLQPEVDHLERNVKEDLRGTPQSLKSPVKSHHCENPVCLRDRGGGGGSGGSGGGGGGPVAVDLRPLLLCSHKSSVVVGHHHHQQQQQQSPVDPTNAKLRFSSIDGGGGDLTSWRTEYSRSFADGGHRFGGGGSDVIQFATVQRNSPRHRKGRIDDYATLPSKSHCAGEGGGGGGGRRRTDFDDERVLMALSSKDQQPSSRSGHSSRVAMATRSSLTSDFVALTSSPPIRHRMSAANRSYVTDYLTFPVRSTIPPAPDDPKTSRDYQLLYSQSPLKLSGSSSTLDVRGDSRTTPLMTRRGTQGCSATSLLDLLSPPFGQTMQQQQQQQQQHSRKPRPGEQDEFGTAV